MSMEVGSLLSSTTGIRHGTSISVHRIAILHNLGHSPEEIVRKYEHLTIAGVHAALAYYYANKLEVDTEIAVDEADAESVEKEFLGQQQVA